MRFVTNRAPIGPALSQCSAPKACHCPPRALARSPSINVIFLAFGEGSPAASLWSLRVKLEGTSDELDETCVAKRTNCASAIPAGPGARALAASTAAFASTHATAHDLVGPSARRRRTEPFEQRVACLGALHPPDLDLIHRDEARRLSAPQAPCNRHDILPMISHS